MGFGHNEWGKKAKKADGLKSAEWQKYPPERMLSKLIVKNKVNI